MLRSGLYNIIYFFGAIKRKIAFLKSDVFVDRAPMKTNILLFATRNRGIKILV